MRYSCKMLVKPFLCRLVVIRTNYQSAIDTHCLGHFRHFDRISSVIRTCTSNNRHAFIDTINNYAEQFQFFLRTHSSSLAGRACYDQAVRAIIDKPFSQISRLFIIDAAISIKRSDHSGQKSAKIRIFHYLHLAYNLNAL